MASDRKPRYLTPYLRDDLAKKMLIITGPRQAGKTTLSKSLMNATDQYLNYDIRNDRKLIVQQEFTPGSKMIVFDELHKMLKWKNYLKGIVDEFSPHKKIIVTGSANLETFRKQGDALTGRYFSYRLHPFCPIELLRLKLASNPNTAIKAILSGSAFPEAFFDPKNASRLLEERFQTLINEDLRDLSRIITIRQFEVLIDILRDRGCGQLNYSNLEGDLSVKTPTVISWVNWLTRLYAIFMIYPWKGATARSLRKEPKFYFYDSAANDNEEARLENLVASALLKHCHFKNDTQGERLELFYYRDKDKREVDFIVLNRKKPVYLIEVKKSDDTLSPSLNYLKSKFPQAKAIQLVQELDAAKVIKTCEIHPLGDWLCNNLLK